MVKSYLSLVFRNCRIHWLIDSCWKLIYVKYYILNLVIISYKLIKCRVFNNICTSLLAGPKFLAGFCNFVLFFRSLLYLMTLFQLLLWCTVMWEMRGWLWMEGCDNRLLLDTIEAFVRKTTEYCAVTVCGPLSETPNPAASLYRPIF